MLVTSVFTVLQEIKMVSTFLRAVNFFYLPAPWSHLVDKNEFYLIVFLL